MSAVGDLRRAKREVRARVRALRDALGEEERERTGAALHERLFSMEGFAAARTVMAFWSFGSEVPTGPMILRLHAEGRRVALPRVVARRIEAREYRPGDPMLRADFGALEPEDGAALEPADVDAVVVPGLAFDRRGYRVGYGGGFYDRFLRRVRDDALVVGICFSVQLVDAVPSGESDVPVAWVVTEGETIRTSALGKAPAG